MAILAILLALVFTVFAWNAEAYSGYRSLHRVPKCVRYEYQQLQRTRLVCDNGETYELPHGGSPGDLKVVPVPPFYYREHDPLKRK